jgi:GTP cyclohydrolase II
LVSPTRCGHNQLQNDGLDTFDANTTLGFDDDERDYGIVARMLPMLNCTRTVLLSRVLPMSHIDVSL